MNKITHLKLKLAIDGSNFDWFSRNQPRFEPRMGRLNVSKLINKLESNQSVGFYMQLLPAAVIATTNHCILSQQEGFPHQHRLC